MTKTDEEKANVLCDYFTEVFTEEDIANIPDAQLHEELPPLQDINFTVDDVEKALMKLKVGKSPGPDQLHPRMLRELASVLKSRYLSSSGSHLIRGSCPCSGSAPTSLRFSRKEIAARLVITDQLA